MAGPGLRALPGEPVRTPARAATPSIWRSTSSPGRTSSWCSSLATRPWGRARVTRRAPRSSCCNFTIIYEHHHGDHPSHQDSCGPGPGRRAGVGRGVGCSTYPAAPAQPAFDTDVLPIFQAHCTRCHDNNPDGGPLQPTSTSGRTPPAARSAAPPHLTVFGPCYPADGGAPLCYGVASYTSILTTFTSPRTTACGCRSRRPGRSTTGR